MEKKLYGGKEYIKISKFGTVQEPLLQFPNDGLHHFVLIDIYKRNTNTNNNSGQENINSSKTDTDELKKYIEDSDDDNIFFNIGKSFSEQTSNLKDDFVKMSDNIQTVTSKVRIALPITSELSINYSADWNGRALTPLEYAIRSLSEGENVGDAFFTFLKRSALSAGSRTFRSGGKNILQQGARGVGFSYNPYKQLIYTAPNFREFSLEWLLAPRNEKESNILKEIIWNLKKYMHTPSSIDGLFFQYPDFCDIEFHMNPDGNSQVNPYLFKLYESAIKNVNVTYDNKFHQDGSPNAVRLRIDFLESKLLTQEDFGETFEKNSQTY